MGSDGITQINNTLTGQAEGSSKGSITGEVNRKRMMPGGLPWIDCTVNHVKHADSHSGLWVGGQSIFVGQFEGGEAQNDFGGYRVMARRKKHHRHREKRLNQRDMGSIALVLISTNNSIFP